MCSIIACSVFSFTTSYAVTIDDQTVGYIASNNNLNKILNEVKTDLEETKGVTLTGTYNTVETKVSHRLFVDKLSDAELADVIDEKVDWLTEGSVLSIDNGAHKFSFSNEAEGQKVLDTLKAEAATSQEDAIIKSIEFQESVTLENTNVQLSQVKTADAALEQIKQGQEAIKTHIVSEGESLWLIAHNNDISVSELETLNPDVNPERMQIGQELNLSKIEPLLNVVLTKELTKQETIAYSTEYKETASLLRGETKTVTEGVEGSKLVTYEVKETNGVALEKAIVDEIVIAQPVNAVIDKGTASVSIASRSNSVYTGGGNGTLSWPKSGKITSPYGTRSRGFHSGIDISAKTGDPVYAAAGGTVVLSSWYYGYGNCIVIDHGNGMKTRYAHLSGYDCKVGDTVTRGQQVGRAGNTGNSTGPHLHFEVIINGKTQNPVNYLS